MTVQKRSRLLVLAASLAGMAALVLVWLLASRRAVEPW